MNYRHAFHAGNHGDVLKHVVLTRLLVHLCKKPKPFRVIDAYAGIGLYALDGVEAGKTGEWEGGIGKMEAPFSDEVEALLAPYRRILAQLNPHGGVRRYPGSPEIAARMMRPDDRMIANELHPEDHARLSQHFRRDERVKVTKLDAGISVKANLPPPERRGVILIDPPYEQPGEAEKAVRMMTEGLRRFATGIFVLWYPVKAKGDAEICIQAAKDCGRPGTLLAELCVREPFKEGGLAGSGLVIVNAPWKLDQELAILLPELAGRLGVGDWGTYRLECLVPES